MKTFKAGWGYWDTTKYPYGGCFKRPQSDIPNVEIIEGYVPYPDEKKVKFPDGRIGVCKSAALK